jgi:hypothetical protein
MTKYPQFEVAISDADRAEIEAIYIELMRERDAAREAGLHSTPSRSIDPSKETGAQ